MEHIDRGCVLSLPLLVVWIGENTNERGRPAKAFSLLISMKEMPFAFYPQPAFGQRFKYFLFS